MKYKAFKTVFTLKGRIKRNMGGGLLLFLILTLCAGCGVESITGATSSISSDDVTLTVTTDKSKISFANTETFTLTASITCTACLSEKNGVTFSYTSNGIISSSSASGDVTIAGVDDNDDNEYLSGTATFQWSGITPTARGTAIITVTELSSVLSTSVTVKIE